MSTWGASCACMEQDLDPHPSPNASRCLNSGVFTVTVDGFKPETSSKQGIQWEGFGHRAGVGKVLAKGQVSPSCSLSPSWLTTWSVFHTGHGKPPPVGTRRLGGYPS